MSYNWRSCHGKPIMVIGICMYDIIGWFFNTFFSPQLKLGQPNPDDLGYADSVSVEEIGGARVLKYIFFLFMYLIFSYDSYKPICNRLLL